MDPKGFFDLVIPGAGLNVVKIVLGVSPTVRVDRDPTEINHSENEAKN